MKVFGVGSSRIRYSSILLQTMHFHRMTSVQNIDFEICFYLQRVTSFLFSVLSRFIIRRRTTVDVVFVVRFSSSLI